MALEHLEVADAAGGHVKHADETNAATAGEDIYNESTAGDIGPTATFRCVSVADEMNPTCRHSMEDEHETIAHFDGDPSMSYFAVYDGHGGRAAVDFVSMHLADAIAEELRAEDGSSIEERMKRAYAATDVGCKEESVVSSGATAITCLLKKAQDGTVLLYTANVGDSRVVLSRDGKAERLSFDHKAEDALEQERIIASGGFILRNRVLGILAVSRSFGDQGMKEFVISVPYVSSTRLCPKCSFLILACDGVWDVLSDDEAVSIVTEALADMGEAGVARALLKEALVRGSTDNITVVVVFF